jgi:hypothetical protein
MEASVLTGGDVAAKRIRRSIQLAMRMRLFQKKKAMRMRGHVRHMRGCVMCHVMCS